MLKATLLDSTVLEGGPEDSWIFRKSRQGFQSGWAGEATSARGFFWAGLLKMNGTWLVESLALLWVMKAWLHTFQRATVFVRKRSESELSWGLFLKSLIMEQRRGPTEAMGSLFRSKKLTAGPASRAQLVHGDSSSFPLCPWSKVSETWQGYVHIPRLSRLGSRAVQGHNLTWVCWALAQN